ncbi:hypothetical protein VNO77_27425 [Canavalia gladiata]|uniref:Uncharacterized protein n=1 Tax=Canavalia gladiata TaxID=3824 RepID=A0AAN9KX89_CANGL
MKESMTQYLELFLSGVTPTRFQLNQRLFAKMNAEEMTSLVHPFDNEELGMSCAWVRRKEDWGERHRDIQPRNAGEVTVEGDNREEYMVGKDFVFNISWARLKALDIGKELTLVTRYPSLCKVYLKLLNMEMDPEILVKEGVDRYCNHLWTWHCKPFNWEGEMIEQFGNALNEA